MPLYRGQSNEFSIIFGKNLEKKISKKSKQTFVRDDANSTIYHNGSEMKYHRNDQKTCPIKWEWETFHFWFFPSRYVMEMR